MFDGVYEFLFTSKPLGIPVGTLSDRRGR